MSVTSLAVSLSGAAGQAVVVALVALATFALAFALLLVFARSRDDVDERLTGYGHAPEPSQGQVQLAETKIIQDAVGLTSRIAERAGVLERVEHELERAELPVRAAEAIFFWFAAIVTGFLLGTAFLGSPVTGGLLAAGVAAAPLVAVQIRSRRRLHAFEEQLPDTLNLLASALKAGFSFLQGVDSVTKEASEPTKKELARVFTEARLGRPIEDALGDAARRMHSRDLEWAVMAIRIQREVGGNLAELLETVADTMTQRDRLRREIGALTAEGRMSAVILGIFPPAFGVVLYALRPEYMTTLFTDGTGVAAVVGAVLLSIVGFAWVRKIVAIEV